MLTKKFNLRCKYSVCFLPKLKLFSFQHTVRSAAEEASIRPSNFTFDITYRYLFKLSFKNYQSSLFVKPS